MAIEISEGHSAPYGHIPNVPSGTRRLRLTSACFTVLVLSACAAVTPPPRFSAVSPADADGPESAVPPPKPMLTGDGELGGEPATAPPPPAGMPDMPGMELGEAIYWCRMHPEVSAKAPGNCPICGMALVEKAPKPQEPRR